MARSRTGLGMLPRGRAAQAIDDRDMRSPWSDGERLVACLTRGRAERAVNCVSWGEARRPALNVHATSSSHLPEEEQ